MNNYLENHVPPCLDCKINGISATITSNQIGGDSNIHKESTFTNQSPCSYVRYCVASLGLLCAIVSCYAQMVFCIAIVEMVIPSNEGLNSSPANLNTNDTTKQKASLYLYDQTCPIDLDYKSFYDEWRFATTTNSSSNNAAQNMKRPDEIYHDRFNWDASQQGNVNKAPM